MAERKFTDYSQIAAMPVRSQQDYLMKYIAGRKLNQYYAYFRGKLPPKEDGSRYTAAGLVTWEERQKASDEVCSDFNNLNWTESNDGELRKLRKHIDFFFKSLNIDPNLFKQDRKYQMTDELIEFFDFILEHDEGITAQIIKHNFNNVSNKAYRYIYSCLLAALKAAPCPNGEKERAKEQFLAFIDEHGIDLSFQHENQIVDTILRITWEKVMEKGWVPNSDKFKYCDEDYEWAAVTERVYQELFDCGLLTPKPDGVGSEKPRLVSDCDIPIRLWLR